MRTLVTGATNPYGRAIIEALLAAGHQVRAFGVSDPKGLPEHEDFSWFPGDLATAGSIEPVLAQRNVLIHAAPMDEPKGDKKVHANRIAKGTLYTRYGAERELVELFIHVRPSDAGRFAQPHEVAVEAVKGLRRVPFEIVTASEPATTANDVVALVSGLEDPGLPPGKSAAVTA